MFVYASRCEIYQRRNTPMWFKTIIKYHSSDTAFELGQHFSHLKIQRFVTSLRFLMVGLFTFIFFSP
jgi:hypothetical protein